MLTSRTPPAAPLTWTCIFTAFGFLFCWHEYSAQRLEAGGPPEHNELCQAREVHSASGVEAAGEVSGTRNELAQTRTAGAYGGLFSSTVIVVMLILEVARPGGQKLAKALAAEIVASSVSFGIYFAIAGAVFLDDYKVPQYTFHDWQLLAGVPLGLFAAVVVTVLAGFMIGGGVAAVRPAEDPGHRETSAGRGGVRDRRRATSADDVLGQRSAQHRAQGCRDPDRRRHRLPHHGGRQVLPCQPQAGTRSRGETTSSGLRAIEIGGQMAVSIFPASALICAPVAPPTISPWRSRMNRPTAAAGFRGSRSGSATMHRVSRRCSSAGRAAVL